MDFTLAAKREEFRSYLENTGILDAMVEALSALFEMKEKPKDGTALDFVQRSLASPESDAVIAVNVELKRENRELQERVKKIEADIAALKKKPTDVGNVETEPDVKNGNESPEIIVEDSIEVEESAD